MFVCLSKNSFVRILDNGKIGYIRNQLSNTDCMFNETGADFLKEIDRTPKEFSEILDKVKALYDIDDYVEIETDLREFIYSLYSQGYLIVGDNSNLSILDTEFSYSLMTPKTVAYQYSNDYQEGHTTQNLLSNNFLDKPFLWSIQIEVTGKCNERCRHCYIPNSFKDKGKDMPFEQFRKIVDEFAQMGGLHITITGGEALLHKNIIDMLNYCRSKDLEITLLSNLISLSEDVIVALKKTNVNMVNVSLYSIDNDIHDYITKVKGSCEKTKAAIELLVKNNIPVQISCPVLKSNKNGVASVINYAKRLKTKASIDYNIVAQKDLKRDNLDNRLSLEEIRFVIEQIVSNRSDYVRFLDETPLDSNKSNPEERPCGAAYSTLNISSTGDINPCSTWGISLGNIFESSLSDIWVNSEKIKEIRKVTFADFPKCQKCKYADYCMTCMAKNYTENGDSMKLNTYFCEVARINKEVIDNWKDNRL